MPATIVNKPINKYWVKFLRYFPASLIWYVETVAWDEETKSCVGITTDDWLDSVSTIITLSFISIISPITTLPSFKWICAGNNNVIENINLGFVCSETSYTHWKDVDEVDIYSIKSEIEKFLKYISIDIR